MKPLLGAGITILCLTAFPVLMLAFPTNGTILRLWSAAMLILSFKAGGEISHSISMKATLLWLVTDVIVLSALMITGVLSLHVESLEYELGLLAVMLIGLGLPVSALQSKIIEER